MNTEITDTPVCIVGWLPFVFDLRPYLINRWRRAGLTAANLVFAGLPIVYAWVALKGVR